MKKKVKPSLEKSSDFESFLGELSAELVNIPLDFIDNTIESIMKKLVDFFDADRFHLGEIQEQQSKINVPYFYSFPGINVQQITEIS